MSSFSKNIVPRREHRERSQPERRVARHGLLEKKKDYKLRARDASRKARRVRLLKEKASFRNPDEFYHAMASSATSGGVVKRVRDAKAVREGDHHTADGAVRRLVETQDRGYVQMKISKEKEQVENGRDALHFLEAAAVDSDRKHIVFVGGDDGSSDEDCGENGVQPKREALETFDRDTHFDRERAHALAVVKSRNGPGAASKSVDEEEALVGIEEGIVPRPSGKGAKRLRKTAGRKGYSELDQRMERVRRLDMAMEDLALRQKLLGKGRRRKVSAGDPQAGVLPVFKWRRVRKR